MTWASGSSIKRRVEMGLRLGEEEMGQEQDRGLSGCEDDWMRSYWCSGLGDM